ncbi:hypothetical protein SDC9_169937 [bioreactor metagenome]|uniref:Uncharacterized protein n=1 Tax=bioreactor metagenome TaxID=1076179 RepID=A0A645GEZ2_9ZZZZ
MHGIGDHHQRVAMHIHALLLRIVDGKSRICGKSIFGLFVIKSIISLQYGFPFFILKEHVAKNFSHACLTVVKNGVADEHLGAIIAVYLGAVQKMGIFGHRIIPPFAGMHVTAV